MPVSVIYQLFPSNNALSYQMTSLFHGFLSEKISPDYADQMHITGLRPFSQSLSCVDGKWFWRVSVLNDEAERNIINILDGLNEVFIRHKNLYIPIVYKESVRKSYDEIFTDNYLCEPQSRYIKIAFNSPTAFKSKGRYINIPTSQLILNSLVRKYDEFSEQTEVGSDELMNQILCDTEISSFNLKSCSFSLEGVRIPAFLGSVTIKVKGSRTFANFVNMLADFGEFSGCGIKNALGMGSIKHVRDGVI